MKKTKLLMPILGVGAVAATVAPMVAMTGCNKEEEKSDWKIVSVDNTDNISFSFVLKYTKKIDKEAKYKIVNVDWDQKEYIQECSLAGLKDEQAYCEIVFSEPLSKDESKKVKLTFDLNDKDGKKIESYAITLNCVYSVEFEVSSEIEFNPEYPQSALFDISWTTFKGEGKETRSVTKFELNKTKTTYVTSTGESVVWSNETVVYKDGFAALGKARAYLSWTGSDFSIDGEGKYLEAQLWFDYTIVDAGGEAKDNRAIFNVSISYPHK